jgi:peptidyl-prolyl cis-trans isomerase D
MMKFMRVHMGKTFLFIVVGGISLVFVLWGVFPESRYGRMGGIAAGDVATVDGEHISMRDLQQAVSRDLESYKALGMELPPDLMENIKISTLQRMVQGKLMLAEARRLGVQASDEEVAEEIRHLPYFQDKEKKTFDLELYRRLLSENHLSPSQFEDGIREQLTNQRMMKFLESRIRVTPGEVEREYKLANETRNLEFVRFSREDAMKKMTVDPKQVDAFLADKNKEGMLTSYYVQNNVRYNRPEQVCARHILKTPSLKMKDTGDGKAPKEFLALKPSAQNFTKVAEKESDDPGSKAKGGDLDCFGKGVMDKAFEDAAFSLPVGQVSAPVHSKFGWHYILVYKKNPAIKRDLADVKREIAEELLKRERLDEIRKLNLAAGEEAMKHWPAKGLESTGPFNGLEGIIPKIGHADEILKAAFDPKSKLQTGPQMFEAQGGVIVAELKEKKSADMAKLEKEKDVQTRTLRERKLRAFLPAWLEDVQKRTSISYNKKLISEL